MMQTVDTMLFGKIYTGDPQDSFVSALGIRDGKIAYAGSKEDASMYIGSDTQTVQLTEGSLVTAGFLDGHSHAPHVIAARLIMCEISEEACSSSADAIVAELSQFIKEHPDLPYYIGHNWYGGIFENSCPTADLLDVIDTDKPIFVVDSGGHSYWVNSAMIALANITKDTPDPEGGRIERYEDGSPNGCFRDTAEFLIRKALPVSTIAAKLPGVYGAQNIYADYGYTGYFEAMTNEQAVPDKYPMIEAFSKVEADDQLDVYTQATFVVNNTPDVFDLVKQGIALRDATKGGMFEVGAIKIYIDGVVEGKTAYLSQPYENEPENYGASRWSDEESLERLAQVIIMANAADMPCHFHTIGDQAVSDALSAVERAYAQLGDRVLTVRNAFTHLQVVKREDIPRFAKLGIVAVLNPWGCKAPGMYLETEVVHLGEERASKEYPYRSFIDAGVVTAFGTDYGCSFIADPIECFHVLTTRTYRDDDPATLLGQEEKLTRLETIRVMTANTAFQMGVEDRMGTLEVGKEANLVVLSKDLLSVPDDEIMSVKVLKTMCRGKWVKE